MAVAALVAGACGRSGDVAKNPTPTATGAPSPKLTGSLHVFAASSLTEAFQAEKAALASKAPGLRLDFSFAGSQVLVQQVVQGAPADVVAAADEKTMQKLVDAKLVETPHVFARNELEIAVAPGNPKGITRLSDLARRDLVVVLADPSVPAGNYTRQALAKAGVTVRPKSLELDVKAALTKVTSGEADATVVYVSDVEAAGGRAAGVPIPAAENVVASYPIAVVRASPRHDAAVAFVEEITSAAGQQVLRAHGFLAG